MCKNQYTECETEMRMHAYFIVNTSHASKCSCGACGKTFKQIPATPGPCDCEVQTLRDWRDEQCTIM
jgi:hypothetical protein